MAIVTRGDLKRLDDLMAGQQSTGVSITGGTITGVTLNNTVIGGTTAAAGTFTTLTGTVITATTGFAEPTSTSGSTASALVYGINTVGTTAASLTYLLPVPVAGRVVKVSSNYATSTGAIQTISVDSTATTIGSTAQNADTAYIQNTGGWVELTGINGTNWRVTAKSTDVLITST